jgi:hypothetical protein
MIYCNSPIASTYKRRWVPYLHNGDRIEVLRLERMCARMDYGSLRNYACLYEEHPRETSSLRPTFLFKRVDVASLCTRIPPAISVPLGSVDGCALATQVKSVPFQRVQSRIYFSFILCFLVVGDSGGRTHCQRLPHLLSHHGVPVEIPFYNHN